MKKKSTYFLIASLVIFTVLINLFVLYMYDKTKSKKEKETDNSYSKMEYKENEVYRLDNIEISIYDWRNPSLGLTSVTFNFVLLVENKEDYQIDSPRLNYETFINGTHVAVGKTYLPDIPAHDCRKYQANFLLSYLDLGKSLISTIKEGKFEVVLKGKISSKGKIAPFTVVYNS